MFTIVVNVDRTLEMGPQSAWRATVQVDGRVIDRSVKGNKQSAPRKVSTMVSEENGKLVKGRLAFPKVVSWTDSSGGRRLMWQRTTDGELAVTLQVAQLRWIGQISITFERGFRVKTKGARDALIAESDVGVASEQGKQ
jgi:hypothetical protein